MSLNQLTQLFIKVGGGEGERERGWERGGEGEGKEEGEGDELSSFLFSSLISLLDDERQYTCNVCLSPYNCTPPTRGELMESFTGLI